MKITLVMMLATYYDWLDDKKVSRPLWVLIPVLLIVALVIDLVKKSDAEGTWQASHFSWRIRTVIWAAVLYLVTLPLWLLFVLPGWIAWGVISIWFLYRIVKGMVRMNANQAMPD